MMKILNKLVEILYKYTREVPTDDLIWIFNIIDFSIVKDEDYVTLMKEIKIEDKHEIVSVTGEFIDGTNYVENSTKQIKELSINIDIDNLKKRLELELANENIQVFASLNEHLQNFDPNNLSSDKYNFIYCPCIKEKVCNDFICISDKLEDAKNINQSIEKLKEVRHHFHVAVDKYFFLEIFYFHPEMRSQIPVSFLEYYAKYFFACFSSFTCQENDLFSYTIKGYKSILFGSNDLIVGELDFESFNALSEWTFFEKGTIEDKLTIVRYLLTLDCFSISEVIKKINNGEILSSAKHQYILMVQGNIKDHFDTTEKIYSNVKEQTSSIDNQIYKLHGLLTSILLSTLPIFIAVLSKFDSKLTFTLTVVVSMLYNLYILLLTMPGIKNYVDRLVENENEFINNINVRIKVISDTDTKKINDRINITIKNFNTSYCINQAIIGTLSFVLYVYLLNICFYPLKELIVAVLTVFVK